MKNVARIARKRIVINESIVTITYYRRRRHRRCCRRHRALLSRSMIYSR
jgi:hypothetical protein